MLDTVLAEVNEAYRIVMARIMGDQGGVPTAFDNVVLSTLKQIREEQSSGRGTTVDARKRMQLFQQYTRFQKRERLEPYSVRTRETAAWQPLPWEPSSMQIAASQGVEQCISWKGHALFKTVFDLAIYPMLLHELRPATIIELGSGTGASAIWLADLLRADQIRGRIYSIDLQKSHLSDTNVEFIQGDGREIHRIFGPEFMGKLVHPWLIIEDMHVNTIGVLRHFLPHMYSGDYIIIEDSSGKQSDLAAFDRESGSVLRVDSRYTDFFGRNATCSIDSIFVKI